MRLCRAGVLAERDERRGGDGDGETTTEVFEESLVVDV